MNSNNYNPECWYKGVCEECKGEDNCWQYREMRFLMANSNIPVAKRVPIALKANSDDIQAYRRLAEIKDDIYNFVYDGKSLYITSEIVGNGKTSWALKLLMKYFEEMLGSSGYEPVGVFVHVPTFLNKLKEFKRSDPEFDRLKDLLFKVDLVVWDDIASAEISSYDLGQLMMYIDNRNMNELSNIYTGNIPRREDIEDLLGVRLASRILTKDTEIVEFKGGNRR